VVSPCIIKLKRGLVLRTNLWDGTTGRLCSARHALQGKLFPCLFLLQPSCDYFPGMPSASRRCDVWCELAQQVAAAAAWSDNNVCFAKRTSRGTSRQARTEMRVGLHSDVVFSFLCLCLCLCLCMPLYHRQDISFLSLHRGTWGSFNFRGNNRSVRTCVDE
jgi:hypothetical protein